MKTGYRNFAVLDPSGELKKAVRAEADRRGMKQGALVRLLIVNGLLRSANGTNVTCQQGVG